MKYLNLLLFFLCLHVHGRAAADTRSFAIVTAYDQSHRTIGVASGFFISPHLLVTNYHVVKDSVGIMAKVQDKTFHSKKFVATNSMEDLVVIEVEGANSESVTLGDSSAVALGDHLDFIGTDGSKPKRSEGVVSGVRGALERLQVTAPISATSSGGPVFNSAGEVIGIAESQKTGNQLLNLVIPVSKLVTMMILDAPASASQMKISAVGSHKAVLPNLEPAPAPLPAPAPTVAMSATVTEPAIAAPTAAASANECESTVTGLGRSDFDFIKVVIASASLADKGHLAVESLKKDASPAELTKTYALSKKNYDCAAAMVKVFTKSSNENIQGLAQNMSDLYGKFAGLKDREILAVKKAKASDLPLTLAKFQADENNSQHGLMKAMTLSSYSILNNSTSHLTITAEQRTELKNKIDADFTERFKVRPLTFLEVGVMDISGVIDGNWKASDE